MRYFVRAVKYFFYFTILFVVIMAALVFVGVVKADVSLMFRDGYKSLWQIALLVHSSSFSTKASSKSSNSGYFS